jgi:pyruvate formate lyase activating enzyme
MKINSIETLGALDGPGIRTVIFFQGCPMRCKYCHNADAFDFDGGEDKSAEEIVNFCSRYKNYYGGDGGATLSGGEPLSQSEDALALIKALKKAGIHTALDTSGAAFSQRVLDEADLVILDIKHSDPFQFEKLTSFPMDNTIKTLEYLKRKKKRFIIRQVIVEGITDDPLQIKALKSLSFGAEKIELLAYHTMGADKWEKCGLSYPLKGVPETRGEIIRELNKLL